MNRRNFLYISGISLAVSSVNTWRLLSQKDTKNGRSKFDEIIAISQKEDWSKLSLNLIIIKSALKFIDTPYVGGTLEVYDNEQCLINFDGLDCVTFFELSLCLARNIKRNKLTIDDLYDEVTYTRYRHGKLNGYESRLHYTSDWAFDNEQKQVVVDFTKTLEGVRFPLNVNFMSKNPKYYKQLKSNPELVKKISFLESEINKRKCYYIPKSKISSIQSEIQSGDIIAITTNKKGIDYSHTGLAYVKHEDRHLDCSFIHASSKKKKVTIEPSLVNYLNGIDSDTGITVLRPLDIPSVENK
jgi:hypothetical protein